MKSPTMSPRDKDLGLRREETPERGVHWKEAYQQQQEGVVAQQPEKKQVGISVMRQAEAPQMQF